ncbi:polysaccharide biosynthesis/export family protein [Flavobacterium luteum]|uniref:Polysaccharide export protein n=1 Tax=Flavobacterium luteum TaxID=2026654 RepID=A0A7J5ADZ8_9FLAO|nr:polysaccharide biosynthesis/export family protein [Flavobacterium luteum]KAB1155794.1 polysaccharide export protein [Flavobacterium luteum]
MSNSLLLKKIVPFFFTIFLLSCSSREKIVYYQNIDSLPSKQNTNSFEIKIQPDDLLMIIVSAEESESAIPFNLKTYNVTNTKQLDLVVGQQSLQLYLVDASGTIEFPVLGKLKVSGYTRSEVLKMFQEKISKYISKPIINLRITNFKFSVQGEVNLPGTYQVISERITLIEALTMAKDLTIYGKRNNILLIREIDGVKSYNRVDITKADFINSPFYYLAQNDVIYVEPNKNKINGAAVGPNTGVIISITSLLITLITLIITSTK